MRPRTRFPVRSYLRHVASRSTFSPVCVVCENSARYSLISVIPRRCPYIYLPPVSSSRRSGQKPSSSPYSLPTRRPHLHGKRSSSPSKVKRGTRAGERTRRALFVSLSLSLPVGREDLANGGISNSVDFLTACLVRDTSLVAV